MLMAQREHAIKEIGAEPKGDKQTEARVNNKLASGKLTGKVIGTELSVDYNSFQPSTTVNTREMAFDGDMQTFFASYDRSYTWCGLDLQTPHVITRIGWAARNDNLGPNRMILGLFEGANKEDFSDAIPLYIITESAKIGEMSYADIDVTRSVRYVRYVGPSDARCNVAEIEFYGESPASSGDRLQLYQLTNLPTVSIKTKDNKEPYDKQHDIQATITIISGDGKRLLQESGNIRLRGNASIEFPKKPYRLRFDKRQLVLNSAAKARKWVLINNYGDKTLMRNMIAFDYSRRMRMEYTPYCEPVDVIVNGEYKGCYQLADHLDVKKGRIDIEEMTPADDSGEAVKGGYFIEIDGYANNEPEKIRFYSARNGIGVTIHSPDEDSLTTIQKAYIQSFFNQMESRVMGSDLSDNEKGWRSRLDADSWLKHFLIGELTGNTDTYWSCHMYKRRGEDKLYTGPEWDFDIAFDNDYRHYPTCNLSDYLYVSAGTHAGFVNRIIKQDPTTKSDIVRLWDMARTQQGITAENICAEIDSLAAVLDASQRLNFMRWPILGQRVHMNPRAAGSYEGEVEFLKDYVRKRIAWIDSKLGYTPYVAVEQTAKQNDIDIAQPCDIYTVSGMCVGSHVMLSRLTLPAGIYIIRQNNITQKFISSNE